MGLLAIYGGAFDPVHDGHLAVARAARDVLEADVALVPTGDPRHRAPAHANAAQRLAMLELAIADEPRLRIDPRELMRSGPSFSVDTLEELRGEHGADVPLAMIVGDDAFAGFPTWHRWRDLFDLAHIVIACRPQSAPVPEVLAERIVGRAADDPAALHRTSSGRVFRLPLPLHPQSSSAIRARIAASQALEGWLPASVAGYIARHGLYRPA
ncbi:nicotinate-nucleotide adenylyltransferase [Xanthomonadaceae bacterium JHOS43]|nr:nicotinate-nucleotide adenylyltransferase [Xanthomonadaceae bacterium JHOS43]MCX7562602.1 nicotinate-nucleotide adenylyltransferase [Xanthomonadaceae bacterium XH05]